MYLNRSPPNHRDLSLGGSNDMGKCKVLSSSKLHNTISSSTVSLYSTSSTVNLIGHVGSGGAGPGSGAGPGGGGTGNMQALSFSRGKRNKKNSWGARERAGMSFLIVIAFFAVFGLIILTELFMIDEKTHNGMVVLRHRNLGSRLGDSLPDYDNVKEDYDLFDAGILMSDNKLGIFQFHSDNKPKVEDSLNDDKTKNNEGANGRQLANGVAGAGAAVAPVANVGIGLSFSGISGITGTGNGNNVNNVQAIPWGKMLPEKIEQTLPPYPIGMTPTDGSWQVVNGTRFKFFVFSAYYDRRDGAKLVRIIGATKTRGPERVWCRFWYTNRDANNHTRYISATVMAKVKVIRENWNLKYSACFVLCPLQMAELEVPQFVSIVSRLRTPPGNLLRVRNTDQDPDFVNSTATPENIGNKIAVCVKPFHFNYDQALYLMEYLELNSLLGVSHFTFYNHTLGSRAECVLNHYMNGSIPGNLTTTDNDKPDFIDKEKENSIPPDGKSHGPNITRKDESVYSKPTVNILPWDLRMLSQKEIRTEGLFASLNDCLYRSMYRYKYLLLVDLDEFIIPRHGDTLNELISWLDRRYKNGNTGAYSFQNAFFYLQFHDDPWIYDTKSPNPRLRAALVTQRKTRRRSKLHPQKQRSKYICQPESVVEVGNHFVWEFSPGKGSLNVPPDAGILHHYRVCEFGGDDCVKSPSVVDRTATKYVNRLVERVNLVYNYLKKPCDLPDLPLVPDKPPPETSDTANETKSKPIIQKADGTSKILTKLPNRTGKEQETDNLNNHPTPSTTEIDPELENKRKVIVFEPGADGQTQARVKYMT